MQKALTPIDASALVNDMAKQLCGEDALTNVDLSDFVAVGSLVLGSGYDNVINCISSLIAKVINQTRAYEGKLWSVMATSDEYGNRILKRKFYSRDSIEARNVNTDKNTTIGDGLNPETAGASQWEQRFAPILEQEFGGSDVWTYEMPTITEDALKDAFRSAEEFAGWLNGRITEAYNEIEQEKEGFARTTVLNRIGGIYQMVQDGDLGSECVVDLIALFNTKCGTTYTRDEILHEHLDEFLKILSAKLNLDSKKLTNRTVKYHWSPAKTWNGQSYVLKQHTPVNNQKMLYYSPLILDAEARVLPTTFHADMLKDVVGKNTSKAEGVEFWQAFDENDEYAGAGINVTVNTPTNAEGKDVDLPFVFGILYDEDGIMVSYQLENVRTTPVHARAGIINTFYNYKKCPINDFTSNAIIYILGEGGEEQSDDNNDNG